MYVLVPISFFSFFTDPATTEIYTLSLHDALPISADHGPVDAPQRLRRRRARGQRPALARPDRPPLVRPLAQGEDRKSTRLNSSHSQISYAVFCLKKKKAARAVEPLERPAADFDHQ